MKQRYWAFGSLAFFAGQFVGKAMMTVPFLLVLGAWRMRRVAFA